MNKKSFNIACVYAGTVLGAGFISGKEIMQFFIRFGFKGILGLILSGIIFSAVGVTVLLAVYNNKIKCYTEFSDIIFGKIIGKFLEILSILFLITLFSAMLSGFSQSLYEIFNIPKIIGIAIISISCFYVFLNGINGIVEVNAALSPILIFGGIFIGGYVFFNSSTETFLNTSKLNNNWIVSSIIYCSYNIITAVSVLCSIGKIIDEKKDAIIGGILGGISMCIMGIFIALPLYKFFDSISTAVFPMLNLTIDKNIVIKTLYIIILICAIFTTAIGNGFAIVDWCCARFNINEKIIKILVVLTGIFLSNVGFDNFISFIYPFFGYIGIIQMLLILFKNKLN